MDIFKILFPIWYTFVDITRDETDEMRENTIILAQELKGTNINTVQEIQEYVNKKSN